MGHDGAVTAIPPRPVVGVLHPGAMGAAVGSALRPRAGAVVWAAAGRSQATSKRAELADLVAVPDVAALARRSDAILSVCPPHAARDDGGGGRRGPRRDGPQPDLRRRERRVAVDGARDRGAARPGPGRRRGDHRAAGVGARAHGAVAGRRRGRRRRRACSPARPSTPGSWAPTSAPRARSRPASRCRARRCRRSGWRWPPPPAGSASRRSCAASWSATGSTSPRPSRVRGGGAAKAWRWAGEMDEAADAVAAAGLPDGFSRAAAEIYRRLADGRLEP